MVHGSLKEYRRLHHSSAFMSGCFAIFVLFGVFSAFQMKKKIKNGCKILGVFVVFDGRLSVDSP